MDLLENVVNVTGTGLMVSVYVILLSLGVVDDGSVTALTAAATAASNAYAFHIVRPI